MGKTAKLPDRAELPSLGWLKMVGTILLSGLLIILVLGGGLQVGTLTARGQISDISLKWDVTDAPTTGHVGLLLTFPSIKISNTGTQKWLSSGNEAVRLGYRWFYPDGKPVPATGDTVWEDLRASLPSDIPGGGSIIFPDFQVSVPAKADSYVLHLDLAQGATGWFATKGATDYTVNVTVDPKDTTPPVANLNFLPLFQVSTSFTVTWSGTDDKNGSGIASYDVQYKNLGDTDWTNWLLGTAQTSALFSGDNSKVYLFRVRATDKAGNVGAYPTNEQASTRVNILPPASRITTLPVVSPAVFLVRWSGFDSVDGSDNQLFDVQFKDGENGTWQDWQNATPGTAAVFKGLTGHNYYFRCRATNYAGLRGDYSDTAQAFTQVNSVLDSAYSGIVPSQQPITVTVTPTISANPTTTVSTPPPFTTAPISDTLTPSVTASSTVSAPVVSPSAAVTTSVAISGTGTTTPAIPSLSATVLVTATNTVSVTISPPPTITTTPSSLQTSAVFPFAVKNGDDNSGTTGIVIENPGNDPLDVFIRFNDHNGAPITTTVNGVSSKTSPDQAQQASRIATLLVTVPAKSTKAVWAGNLPVGTFNGWVSLFGNSPFQAWAVRLPKAGQPIVYTAPVQSNKLYLPYLKKAGSTGSSFINLANPNPAPADVQITYYDAATGQIAATKTYQLPLLGSLRVPTFGLATSNQANSASEEHLSGAAVISASVPLAASVELPQADGSYSTYAAVNQVSNAALPTVFYKDVSGFGTALAIQNISKDPVVVKTDYLDANGVVVGSDNVNVPGYGRVVVLSQNVLRDQPHFQGQARVSATGGNIAVVTIGGPMGLQSSTQQQFP